MSCQWIRITSYNVCYTKLLRVPLQELVDALRAGQPLPDRTAAITFDDGYISIYDTAWPLLRARGWPFTVFVNTEPP